MSTLLSPTLCSRVTCGECINPKTGVQYADKSTRCSLLNSGTPSGYLCRQFLGSADSVRKLSVGICAREPSLPECRRPQKCGPVILYFGIALVALGLFVYKKRREQIS